MAWVMGEITDFLFPKSAAGVPTPTLSPGTSRAVPATLTLMLLGGEKSLPLLGEKVQNAFGSFRYNDCD